jgi:cell division protein FtsW
MALKLKVDEWLFAAAVGLALFGVVMVYSASAALDPLHYVVRQSIWTGLGLVAMLGAMRINYEWLRSRIVVYGLLALALLLLLAVFAFPRINGAHRWIIIGGLSFQPSEISKLALVVAIARFLERRAGNEGAFWSTFAPCVGLTGVLAALVAAEPDLGTAMMLITACGAMLFAAGARIRHLALAAAPAIICLAGLLVLVPWRLQRLVTFLDPWAAPQDAGYQVVQSLIAVGSGGVDGAGFAAGKQKLFFLPFAHSDFIFAVISEELGFFGALVVLGLFGLFLWRGVRAVLGAPDRFSLLLSFGIVVLIVTQALFNISVVLSLVPTKGIPLPFISYGGSSLLTTLFSVGLLLNISQYAGTRGTMMRTAEAQRYRDHGRQWAVSVRRSLPFMSLLLTGALSVLASLRLF